MLHEVLVLLVVVHVQQPRQLLLDLPVALDLVVYLLHLVVDLVHVVLLQPVRLLPAVGGQRLGQVLRVALVQGQVQHFLPRLFDDAVELEGALAVVAAHVAVGVGPLAAVALRLLHLVQLGVAQVLLEDVGLVGLVGVGVDGLLLDGSAVWLGRSGRHFLARRNEGRQDLIDDLRGVRLIVLHLSLRSLGLFGRVELSLA